MKLQTVNRVFAATQISTGILLPLWWILMGILLPVQSVADDFSVMITHANWVPVNLVGMIACVAWVMSLPVFAIQTRDRFTAPGFAGVLLAGIGALWFACIQYYETFIWPVAAVHNPELVQLNGALVFGERLVAVPLLLSGLAVASGYVLMFVDNLRRKGARPGIMLILTAGVVIFGNGIVFPVRTVGMVLFSYAMIMLGMQYWRNSIVNTSNSREYLP